MKLRELFDPVNQKSQPAPSMFDKINTNAKRPTAPTPLQPNVQASTTPKPAQSPAPVPVAEPAHFNPTEHKELLIQVAKKQGIMQDTDLARLLGQANKETLFWKTPIENLRYTTPQVIYKNFTRLFTSNADPKIQTYIRNPVKLANDGYAGKNGNGDAASGDGWKYRGRGFIQVTGRDNYALVGRLVHPENPSIYVNNPDLLATNPKESAIAAVKFFLHRVGKGASQAKANRGISGHARQAGQQRQQLTQQELALLRKQKTKPKPTK
jgi:putative chitinase